jgi:hypothetical protein
MSLRASPVTLHIHHISRPALGQRTEDRYTIRRQICRRDTGELLETEPSDLSNDRLRRVSPFAVQPGEGPLTERTAGVQPVRREQVFMPHTRRSQYPP